VTACIKTSAALIALALPGAATLAQPAIYSNGSADPSVVALSTGAVSGSGVAAPAGGTWSELQGAGGVCNAAGGFAGHATGAGGAFRLADDFVVADNPGWRVDAVAFYAYQTGASGATSPFSGVNVRVWNGRPGDAGSTVVFGDTSTNRMTAATSTGIYRTFNTTVAPATSPDSSKLIWRLQVDMNHLFLAPGHYWLDWQYTTLAADGEAFSPAATLLGTRTQSGWNARQLGTSLQWADLGDGGKPATAADVSVDLPFMLIGFAGTQPCNADFNGDGDVGTDADIEAFFACLAGDCCARCGSADFNGDGDVGTDADIEAFFRVLAGHPC
jgi:hypothetical protein